MIEVNSEGGVSESGVFLTNLDEIGSLNHSCMHNTNNVHPANKRKKKKNKQEKKKTISKPSLGYLDLTTPNWAISQGRLLYESNYKLISQVEAKYGGRYL